MFVACIEFQPSHARLFILLYKQLLIKYSFLFQKTTSQTAPTGVEAVSLESSSNHENYQYRDL